jgi:integrase
VIERANVPRIRFHDLRHSAASYLIALGVDVNTVSKILGHHSAHFTLQRYVHDVSGTKTSAITKLEAHLLEAISDQSPLSSE